MTTPNNSIHHTDESLINYEGIFGGQSVIRDNVSQILSLIPDEERQSLDVQLNILDQSAKRLRNVASEYLQISSGYDFEDYTERLRLPAQEVLRILEEEILQKNGVRNFLGQAFYSYTHNLSDTDLADTEKLKLKVIKDFGLANLVYERLDTNKKEPVKALLMRYAEGVSYPMEHLIREIPPDIKKIVLLYIGNITKHPKLQDLKDHIKFAAQTGMLEEISIDFDGLTPSDAEELSATARQFGLNLTIDSAMLLDGSPNEISNALRKCVQTGITANSLKLSDHVNPALKDFDRLVEMTHIVGLIGISKLSFSAHELLGVEQYLKLITVAGMYEIKSINFAVTHLDQLDVKEIMQIISHAGACGIKYIHTGLINLKTQAKFEEFQQYMNTSSNLGVRALQIDFSHLDSPYGFNNLLSLIEAFGRAGIRELHFGDGMFFREKEILESSNPVEEVFMRIIAVAAGSGINVLHLRDMYQGEKFSDKSMQRLTDTARLHNFTLGFIAKAYNHYVIIS